MDLRASVVAVSLSLAAAAAFPADRGEAKGAFAGKSVSIDYGRPSLQGRDMLGQAKVGVPWRMGADAPTMLKTAAELTFSPSVVVPPGEYVLTATKIDPEKWQVDVKRANGDPLAIPLVSRNLSAPVEQFTIELSPQKEKGRGELVLKWGTTALSAPFSAR
jgi:Protein of unknown function (DUF2911)